MVEYTEHNTLVTELVTLENYSPEKRLAHAKTRRQEQLGNYENRHKNGLYSDQVDHASHNKNIRFESNIELIEAAARNDAEEVEYFVNHGVSPDLQNEDGLSALHQAVIEDCEDVVNVLVENGANLNIKDADCWTPLHAAVACGNYELVKYLVDNGASMVEINTDGNMPIDLVEDNEDNEDIEIFLDEAMANAGYTKEDLDSIRDALANEMMQDLRDSVANGRSLSVTGEHGETAMHIAAANGYKEVVEYLLDHGAKIDTVDNDFWQPIHAAACWGQDKIIELLVNHGADLDARTKDGETPVDLTEDEELQGMIIELKESGHKTGELKRSQSNSSRTLSVRRSSIVEKHRISVNDAKQEGIFRQNPEFLHVVIKTDDDVDEKDMNGDVSPTSSPVFKGQDETPTPINEEKEKFIFDKKTNVEKPAHLNPVDKQVIKFKAVEEKITIESDRLAASSTNVSPAKRGISKQTPHKLEDVKLESKNNGDVERGEIHTSHNTAASHDGHKTLTQSTDMSVKKKCCVIL